MAGIFSENNNILYNKDIIEFVQFVNLKHHESVITHGFSTRRGGVSTGECNSLNFGFNRNDSRNNVEENYRRLAEALNIKCENMVFSNQVHDNKVKVVDEKDRGKGILHPSDIKGYDALITNVPEVALITFYADCVPVLFFDPIQKAIGISHSGWKGTVKEIAARTVEKMHQVYGCNPSDIIVAIGPSISQCCFEVDSDVYEEFVNNLGWSNQYCAKSSEAKWNIDLQSIIKQSLINSGVRQDNIVVAGICTKCNNDVFFSHRGDMGKTGSMVAVMQINRE